MGWGQTIRTALEALWTRKTRSLLTVLGILIGVTAVMTTVGLGQGAQQQVAAQIGKLGSNLLVVSPGSATSTSGVRGGRGSATTLTSDDAAVLANPAVAPDISHVAPASQGQQTLTAGTNTWTTTVVGTTPDWLAVRARTVDTGRFFTAGEVADDAPVAVIGTTTASQLFGARSPVGQQVSVNGTPLTVVGELTSIGSTASTDDDDQLVVPRTTYATRLSSSGNARAVSAIYLQAKDDQSLSSADQEATNALLNAHSLTPATADFTVSSQQALVQTATSTTRILTVLLGSLAAVSLLVGGIGVMNIMLVSVTERIHEIGLRKALGATPRAIARQFLVEAGALGIVGGIAGIGVGLLLALALPAALGQPVATSWTAAALALAVSLLIGLVAGVYPATRAAALAPIDALRNE